MDSLIFIFYLLLSFIKINLARIEDYRNKNVKIGYVFILTTQREFGLFQQVSVWENYFRNVPKSQYATIVVNWPFGEHLPSFVSIEYSHETDYGGTRYIESYIAASKLLVEKFNVTGTILLSGSCLPVRPFHYFYKFVSPHLSLGHTILRDYPAKEKFHIKRYEKLKSPRLGKNEWFAHSAQGYILHSGMLHVLFRTWRTFVIELQGIESIDEHYVSYIVNSLAKQRNYLGVFARNIRKNLVKMQLIYSEWQRNRPRIWNQNFTRQDVQRIRKSHDSICFVRKVSHTCYVDSSILE